ncbi:MAG: alkaline phosphatase D family protein [Candidatus Sericytochromatia bacterium]|nr:alkaline phosphatase D family protein [Candidatus Tanganyikabacteria bacterium]
MLAALVAATLQSAAVPAPPRVAPEGDALRLAATAAFPNGVAAGDVSQDSAVLWARFSGTGNVRFEYGTDPAFHSAASTPPVPVADSAQPAKAGITGLRPGTQYYYRAVSPGGAYSAGSFRTPAAPGERTGRLRFGVSGDWDTGLAPFPAVRNVASRDLDCFVALGDAVYADHATPALPRVAVTLEEYRTKHLESLIPYQGLNVWPAIRASTPFYAMIDDHEVVDDFAGGAPAASDPRFSAGSGEVNETPRYRAGVQAFHEYMPIRHEVWPAAAGPRMSGKPRLYRHRTFGGDAAFMLLDARSFRDAKVNRVLTRDLWAAGTFLFSAAWPGRSLLGRPQLRQLEDDLLAAERAGITWKFVFVPQPIQAFGVLAADDRFEGYAAERTELLSFIHENRLTNVVFVTADFHGQVVNNLTYSWWPLTPANHPATWEIITGPVAVDSVLGPSIARIGARAGFIPPDAMAEYSRSDRAGKDRIIRAFIDRQIKAQYLDPVGLDGSPVPATLESGEYVAVHYFGWTEFEIAGPDLVVTTWGIDAYNREDLAANPGRIAALEPQIVTRFRVRAAGN